MKLAVGGRHQRDGEQDQEPRRIGGEADRQGRHGDEVLRLAEDELEDRGAARHLAAGAIETVLLIGGLELFEVERRGVAHELQAGAVAVALREQVSDQRGRATEQIGQDAEAGLGQHQQRHGGEPPRRDPVAEGRAGMRQARVRHHRVDDQLADVERRGGQQGAEQAQGDGGQRQPGARPPHETEQARQVAQRAEAVAKGRGPVGHGVLFSATM